MRRLLLTVAAILGLVVPMAVTATSATAAPYCGIRWGSLPKTAPLGSGDPLFDVRTGRHPCFDRLVLDVAGDVRGYSVQYVDRLVQDGSGTTVPVSGGARIEVTARVPVVPTDSFFTGRGRDVSDVAGYRAFRQVVWVGSFEGQSTVGLGVRARLPFRVFLLDGPGDGSRMVVDVAHRW
ncbi:AMIN-like domain-containing (lipo)protein [Thalassiella azotivora]